MNFPEQLRKVMLEIYAAREKAAKEGEEDKKFRGTIRITVRLLDDLRKELSSDNITWYSDGSRLVGGKGEHPGALQHFISSIALCQMSHYAERASVWGLKLDSLEMSVKGHFVRLPGRGFDEIEYETRIVSPENPDRIKELVVAAEHDCYVTNTLKHACKVGGRIFLNGMPLMETRHSSD